MSSNIAENEIKPNLPKKTVKRRVNFIEWQARLPLVVRVFAVLALVVTIIIIGLGFWRTKPNDFVMKSKLPQLSTEVKAVVNGYERRVTEGERIVLYIKADKDTTFTDEHHELENIYLENYPVNSAKPDKVSAAKAVYLPEKENPENFKVFFIGNVNVESRDGLKLQAEQLVFDRAQETVETESALKFLRENISGSAVGAFLNIKDKHLTLNDAVDIDVVADESADTNIGATDAKIRATKAVFDQTANRLELQNNVEIHLKPRKEGNGLASRPTDITTDKAVALVDKELKKVDLIGNVNIIIKQHNAPPTTIRAAKALYDKPADKIELTDNVEIVTAAQNTAEGNSGNTNQSITKSAVIHSDKAVYEQASGKINLTGNASVQQGADLMRGNAISADLSADKKLQKVITHGNGFLHSATAERTTDASGDTLTFDFDEKQEIQNAKIEQNVKVKSTNQQQEVNLSNTNLLNLAFQTNNGKNFLQKMAATGSADVLVTALQPESFSKVSINTTNGFEVLFASQNGAGVISETLTNGRTSVLMTAPPSNNAKAANKKITADSLKLFWHTGGKDIEKAEAAGNAEIIVDPLQKNATTEKQTLTATRFDVAFFESGNAAQTAVATGSAKAVLEPSQPTETHGTRTLSANKMTANFVRESQEIQQFDAVGNTKFNEGERNGIAANLNYTANDEIVRLRGGEPTIWDNQARIKALEIDLDTRRQISNLRGKVATTYYSQKQTNGATPFSKVNSPVYLTANEAELNQKMQTAVYTGNARAWQENNYVRAEKLVLNQQNKTLTGETKVQSALYNAKRTENGAEKVQPVFAFSDNIFYTDAEKFLRYTGNVDIRQGTDRITSGLAEVFLSANNDVLKTIAQTNVVVTQPNRKATGDWAQYTTADEIIILRGNPAFVEDTEQGKSSGAQLTVFMRENRIVGQGGKTPTAPGRVRGTFKVKKN